MRRLPAELPQARALGGAHSSSDVFGGPIRRAANDRLKGARLLGNGDQSRVADSSHRARAVGTDSELRRLGGFGSLSTATGPCRWEPAGFRHRPVRDYEPEVLGHGRACRIGMKLWRPGGSVEIYAGNGEDWGLSRAWTSGRSSRTGRRSMLREQARRLRLVKGRKDRRVPRIPTHPERRRRPRAGGSSLVRYGSPGRRGASNGVSGRKTRSDDLAVSGRRIVGGNGVDDRGLAHTPPRDGARRKGREASPRPLSPQRGASLVRPPRRPTTRPRLDADGKWVVFRAGNRVFALNGETGKVTGLRDLGYPRARSQASGGRVYWADQLGRSRPHPFDGAAVRLIDACDESARHPHRSGCRSSRVGDCGALRDAENRGGDAASGQDVRRRSRQHRVGFSGDSRVGFRQHHTGEVWIQRLGRSWFSESV